MMKSIFGAHQSGLLPGVKLQQPISKGLGKEHMANASADLSFIEDTMGEVKRNWNIMLQDNV